MRPFQQLAGAILLLAATYFGIYRIAEAKNETAVGGGVFALDDSHRAEAAAFDGLRGRLSSIGEGELAERLQKVREGGALWVAPSLGPANWALYVKSLRLVRRIYVRQIALVDPVRHLLASGPLDAPPAYQQAFGWLSLAGALRHELAHYEGQESEAAAYGREIAWYQGLRASPWFEGLGEADRRMWDWALDSAIRTAEAARARAGA